MVRKFSILLVLIILTAKLFAQNPALPLSRRQVSGIVTDSAKQAITGATVTLISKTDTLKTSTNEKGLFFFMNVKSLGIYFVCEQSWLQEFCKNRKIL
ncbi:MAG TPA: hypothetical protein DIT07_09185 [Sphingobacteriaceae bacterium]|nr:hypothetical protein [Sphingobacteriaceae bacterium]